MVKICEMIKKDEGTTREDKGTVRDNEGTVRKDRYALFRHATFCYLSYYLRDFFKRRNIKNQAVMEDASLGRKTLSHMLEGKDMSLNCYLRLLTAMKRYCADDAEYLEFIMGFLKRAIIEIWLLWREEPEGWMMETWREMEREKMKYYAEEKLEVRRKITTFTGVKK